jgi:hypothetical protein
MLGYSAMSQPYNASERGRAARSSRRVPCRCDHCHRLDSPGGDCKLRVKRENAIRLR